MSIHYNHSENMHTLAGPQAALPVLLDMAKPSSLLDVGCGTGTWLRVARDLGMADIFGVDGVNVPEPLLLISRDLFAHHDLTQPLRLGRKFDLALSLEVAEHLEIRGAEVLIASLTAHANTIFFSAACPGQPGQHHVNCQWPEYWQKLFNLRGFACDDAVRWRMWSDSRVEPWYRQNMFMASRDSVRAGKEPRIIPVIHPELMPHFETASRADASAAQIRRMEEGHVPVNWYFSAAATGIWSKVRRHF